MLRTNGWPRGAEPAPGGESEGAEDGGLDLRNFEDASCMLVNVPCVEVIVTHQGLNPAELGLMAIVKIFSNDPLKSESKDISAFSCVVVKTITEPMKKVEAFLELTTGVFT